MLLSLVPCDLDVQTKLSRSPLPIFRAALHPGGDFGSNQPRISYSKQMPSCTFPLEGKKEVLGLMLPQAS